MRHDGCFSYAAETSFEIASPSAAASAKTSAAEIFDESRYSRAKSTGVGVPFPAATTADLSTEVKYAGMPAAAAKTASPTRSLMKLANIRI